MKVTILFWMWNDVNLSNRPFTAANVNTVCRAIRRHSSIDFRFVCIADSLVGFDDYIEAVPTPKAALDAGRHRSPEGGRFPSCYRRLWGFSEDAAKMLGERVFAVDIDHVPTADYAPIVSRAEEFVGWRPYRDWGAKLRFGGGSYLMTPGTRAHVWADFKGAPSIQRARAAGFRGSDQAWISYCLAHREPYFTKDAGIYSIRDMSGKESRLPADARLVHFNGPVKPWQSTLPWVREHFQ